MPKRPHFPSTAARLDAWIRAFTARPDIHIEEHKRGPTWKGAHTAIFEPRELDAFYTENNGYALRWLPSKKAADSEGGILRIPKRSGKLAIWHKDPGHREVSPYLEGMIVDEPTGELTTLVIHRYVAGTRKKERVIASDNASGNSARYFDSFAAYLEEGARKAFTWYWPWYEAGEGLLTLLSSAWTPMPAMPCVNPSTCESGVCTAGMCVPSAPLPLDKNIAIDSQGNLISVNSPFIDVCLPPGNAPPGVCSSGPLELVGNGMGGWGNNLGDGGATPWLINDSPVLPGETMDIEFILWDAGDHAVDSLVLLDDFRWNITPSAVGVHK